MMADPIVINASDVTTIASGATSGLDVTLQGINIVWQGAYYNSDGGDGGSASVDFRVYASKSMTLTAESNISKVEIAGYCKAGLTVTANAGTITTGASYASETTKGTLEDPLIVVDEIGATSVTLTCTKQMRAYIIRVTLAGSDVPPTPAVEAIVYNWAVDPAAGHVGTTILGAGTEVSTVKIHTNTLTVDAIKFGSSYVYAEGKYITIKPAEGGFKAGDELGVMVWFSNADDSTKYCMVDVFAADGATRLFRSDSASTVNGRLHDEDAAVQTYVLASDQDSLLIGRYGNTSMFVNYIKVTRKGGEVVPPTPVVLDTLTVAQAMLYSADLADNAQTDTVMVMGYAVNVAKYDVGFGNQEFYLADDATSTSKDLMAFRAKPTKDGVAYPVLAGDKVILRSVIKKYVKDTTTAAQFELMYPTVIFVEEVPGDRSIEEAETITVAEALTIGQALASKTVGEDTYDIVGYISQIDDDSYETSYKNMTFWIVDESGKMTGSNAEGAFQVYRGKPDQHLELGDKIQVTTKIQKYGDNDVIESVSGATVKFLEKGVPPTVDTLNVADAYAAAQALEQNTESPIIGILGYVAKIKTEYNEKFGNISFYMTDDKTSEHGDLQVYRGKISKEEGEALAHGDLVLVVGKLKHTFKDNNDYYEVAEGSSVSVLSKQAIENIVLTEKVNKVLMDGVIYIVRDGKLYNLQGAQVR
jgi:hypothetical protein